MAVNFMEKFPIFRGLDEDTKASIKKIFVFESKGENAFFVTMEDDVFAMGSNNNGCLGNGDGKQCPKPTKVEALCKKEIKSISCGPGSFGASGHLLALSAGGAVFSWGWNKYGQLGVGTSNSGSLPVKAVTHLQHIKIVQVACGCYHSMALSDGGEVFAWGWNGNGQIGSGTIADHLIPQRVIAKIGKRYAVEIACGSCHSVALMDNGDVYSWGFNENGQLGIGNSSHQSSPCKTTLYGVFITQIVCGPNHTLALSYQGILYVWGSNSSGQLGIGGTTLVNQPRKMNVNERFAEIAVCPYSDLSAGLSDKGKVYKWGNGRHLVPFLTSYATICEMFASLTEKPFTRKFVSFKYKVKDDVSTVIPKDPPKSKAGAPECKVKDEVSSVIPKDPPKSKVGPPECKVKDDVSSVIPKDPPKSKAGPPECKVKDEVSSVIPKDPPKSKVGPPECKVKDEVSSVIPKDPPKLKVGPPAFRPKSKAGPPECKVKDDVSTVIPKDPAKSKAGAPEVEKSKSSAVSSCGIQVDLQCTRTDGESKNVKGETEELRREKTSPKASLDQQTGLMHKNDLSKPCRLGLQERTESDLNRDTKQLKELNVNPRALQISNENEDLGKQFHQKAVSGRSILDAISKSFDDPSTSDMTFVTNGGNIHCHKTILIIRSNYLRTKLKTEWNKAIQNSVKVSYPYDVYKAFLYFLYTDTVELGPVECMDLLELANSYEEACLKSCCEEIVIRGITVENSIILYSKAVKYDVKEIEECCFRFIVDHIGDVTETEAFSELDKTVMKVFAKKLGKLAFFK